MCKTAYYQQQYDQATRIYQRLLKNADGRQDEILDILSCQQMMVDELSRLKRLINQYAQPKVSITSRKIIHLEKERLN